MSASPLIEFIAREHPAFVHIPIGLVAVLPLAIYWRSPDPKLATCLGCHEKG